MYGEGLQQNIFTTNLIHYHHFLMPHFKEKHQPDLSDLLGACTLPPRSSCSWVAGRFRRSRESFRTQEIMTSLSDIMVLLFADLWPCIMWTNRSYLVYFDEKSQGRHPAAPAGYQQVWVFTQPREQPSPPDIWTRELVIIRSDSEQEKKKKRSFEVLRLDFYLRSNTIWHQKLLLAGIIMTSFIWFRWSRSRLLLMTRSAC